MIIADVFKKMRIMEDAIEEHEKIMTERDNTVEEFSRREKEYVIHIRELERVVESIMKNKTDGIEDFHLLYDDLKLNFEKERKYYLDKIKHY